MVCQQVIVLGDVEKQAQIEQKHEVLEIGFGWGSMALEVVKLTGCKYTGITLSEEQLKFAQERVKKAGLEVLNPYLAYKGNFMQTIL